MAGEGKYFKVYDWMLNFGLNADEVLALAYIHSLTVKGKTFYGSVQVLATKIGRGRISTIQILHRLAELGLLIKVGGQGKVCTYSTPDNLSEVTCSKSEQLKKQNLNKTCSKNKQVPVQKMNNTCSKSEHNNSNYNSKNNSNHNNRAFIPPTWNEVALFVSSRGWTDPEGFGHYYVDARTAGEWLDKSGNPITNWKSNIISSWEVNNKSKTFPQYHEINEPANRRYRSVTLEQLKNELR